VRQYYTHNHDAGLLGQKTWLYFLRSVQGYNPINPDLRMQAVVEAAAAQTGEAE
jgi:hypothetical protein